MLKAVMMACFGLMLSNIGLDPITSSPRMTFGILELFDGVGIAPVAMGLFGIGEVLVNLEQTGTPEIIKTKFRNLFPSKLDWFQSRWALVRGTLDRFFPGYSTRRRSCPGVASCRTVLKRGSRKSRKNSGQGP